MQQLKKNVDLKNRLKKKGLEEGSDACIQMPQRQCRGNGRTCLGFGELCLTNTVGPPYLWFCLLWFQLPVVNCGLEADNRSEVLSEGQQKPNATSQSFPSCHRITQAFYHLTLSQTRGERANIRYKKIYRERPYSCNFYHIYYYCSILTLFIAPFYLVIR